MEKFINIPERNKGNIIDNLKQNWFFPVSALAFSCMSVHITVAWVLSAIFAFVASVIIASQISSMVEFAKQVSRKTLILSILTSIGICWGSQQFLYSSWIIHASEYSFMAYFPAQIDVIKIISILGAIVSVYFVLFFVLVIYNRLAMIFSRNYLFADVGTMELIAYSILILLAIIYILVVYTQTRVFYAADCSWDVIYTSDAASMVDRNVYLGLTHPENDLRQPLFAVFTAPFIGLPYLISNLLGGTPMMQAILMNIAQVLLLFVANFVLAQLMNLQGVKRVCFMVFISSTYTQVLFTLMIEQYIFAYFWLILCLYTFDGKHMFKKIALYGAGSTLLTSLALLPFISEYSPFKDFKKWFMDVIQYGIGFVGLMLVFCRFDVIYTLPEKFLQLAPYTGREVSLQGKVLQYIMFAQNCFVAPNAGINDITFEHVSWQLKSITNISWGGIVILILVIVSAILNREKLSSRVSMGWVVFSIAMLVGIGWGTMENGLILYALYFGWAFLVLLFQLVEWIEDKLHTKIFVPIISLGCTIALVAINIPAIMKMIDFAITYYPV